MSVDREWRDAPWEGLTVVRRTGRLREKIQDELRELLEAGASARHEGYLGWTEAVRNLAQAHSLLREQPLLPREPKKGGGGHGGV